MNLEYNEHQDFFKIVVIGNTGVGKSNIIQTYDKGTFIQTLGARPNHVNPTIGVDYSSKIISLENNSKVRIQIWDTAGQEQYRSITMSHYRNSNGALIVFDVTNRNSFEDIHKWISDVRDRANQNIVIGIIGNKVDSERRAVSREQGENAASKEHAFYMETSIFDLGSLKNAFERLAQGFYFVNQKQVEATKQRTQSLVEQIYNSSILLSHQIIVHADLYIDFTLTIILYSTFITTSWR